MKLESDEFEMDRRNWGWKDRRYKKNKKKRVEVGKRMRKDIGTKRRRYELILSDCTRGTVHHVPH